LKTTRICLRSFPAEAHGVLADLGFEWPMGPPNSCRERTLGVVPPAGGAIF